MNTPSSIVTEIEHRLQRVYNKQNRVDLLSNTFISLAGAILIATVLVVTEILFEFSRVERTVISLLFLVTLFVNCIWMIGRPFLRLVGILSPGSEDGTARSIGAFFPSISRTRLFNS